MALLPNVAAARALAESAMVDTCTITRDAQGSADDTLNDVTGELSQPTGDATTVYSGPCLLRTTAALRARSEDEGGAVLQRRIQAARLPVSAAEVKLGDVLTVTAAAHDPQLVGRPYRVLDSEVNTFAVTRKVELEDLDGSVVR